MEANGPTEVIRTRKLQCFFGSGEDILITLTLAQGDGHLSAATYLANMAKPGTWGDEIMLMAIAHAHSISIMVYSGIDPGTGSSHATIYPHHADGPHYGLYHLARSQHYELLFP